MALKLGTIIWYGTMLCLCSIGSSAALDRWDPHIQEILVAKRCVCSLQYCGATIWKQLDRFTVQKLVYMLSDKNWNLDTVFDVFLLYYLFILYIPGNPQKAVLIISGFAAELKKLIILVFWKMLAVTSRSGTNYNRDVLRKAQTNYIQLQLLPITATSFFMSLHDSLSLFLGQLKKHKKHEQVLKLC